MQGQLSLPLDRKLQNSLILSMKSAIEERIRQSSVVILQLLYTHFHRDHHEQKLQQRRSSTPLLGLSTPPVPTSNKTTDETNNNNPTPPTNNSTVKVSALVAHYSSAETPSSTNVCISHLEIIENSIRKPTLDSSLNNLKAFDLQLFFSFFLDFPFPRFSIGTCSNFLFLL